MLFNINPFIALGIQHRLLIFGRVKLAISLEIRQTGEKWRWIFQQMENHFFVGGTYIQIL